MVIATKGLLNLLSERNELDDIMTTANRAIKNMKLHMLTMLRIQEHGLSYSSAGMPPLLIYRQQSDRVEQFVLKGMPRTIFRTSTLKPTYREATLFS